MRKHKLLQNMMKALVLGLGFAGLAVAGAGSLGPEPPPEGQAPQQESLRGVGSFALRVPPRALGAAERGEVRSALTPEELKDMRISSVRSLGEAFLVNALSDISEVGLILSQQPGRVDGRIKTPLGGLRFQSTLQEDGKVLVEFDLGREVVGMRVDPGELVAVPVYGENSELTPADKFAFRALAVLLKKQGGALTRESDTLQRVVNLWSELVPVGPTRAFFRDQVITPEGDRSWTTICNWSSANLCHDAASHSTACYNTAVGPNAYRCRGRCGSGCDAIIGTSAWTIDCGEHDHCLESHYNGECFYCGDCGDEASSAQDDFLFAGNCSY